MDQRYQSHGIGFRFPDGWSLQEQEEGGDRTISVQSPETSFWAVSLLPERPEPADVIEAAVAAFEEEYPDLDVYTVEAELCRQPTLARDLDFVCLDLVNSAALRAFRTGRYTVLVLYQGNDRELEHTRELLEGISRSLYCELEDVA